MNDTTISRIAITESDHWQGVTRELKKLAGDVSDMSHDVMLAGCSVADPEASRAPGLDVLETKPDELLHRTFRQDVSPSDGAFSCLSATVI